jgi:hypothetical protein
MKNWFLAVPAALALSASCGPSPVGFDIPKPIDEQTIPGNLAANAAGMALPPGSIAPVAVSVDLAAESTSRRIPIGRVLLKSFRFDVTSTAEPAGDTDDFSFVRSARVFFECTAANCTLPRVEVASATDPGAVRSMNFTVSSVNVKPYIDQGVRVTIELDAIPPPDDTSFNGAIVLRVEPF